MESLDTLEQEYNSQAERAEGIRVYLHEKLQALFRENSVTLAVPLESRVKTWESIREKLERKSLSLEQIADLNDLIGFRIILLFSRDVEKVRTMIRSTFDVTQEEDKSDLLRDSMFGYHSVHYVVLMPAHWREFPFLGLDRWHAEIQVRTIAQHLWAAASHKLQYKMESGVPAQIRRSIYRVSALLETVDLEFERVLAEREEYIKQPIPQETDDALNVDNLAQILYNQFPKENLMEFETYAELLQDLARVDIESVSQIRELIIKNMDSAFAKNEQRVKERRKSGDYRGTSKKRIDAGVFYNHVGLMRIILTQEFGDKWLDDII